MPKRWRYLYRVGVELEGGWHNRPCGLTRDGSVHVDADHVGEVPSPVLTPENLLEWMDSVYPDLVNGTCGLHVHVSVRTVGLYSILMERDFYDHLKKSLEDWGKRSKVIARHPFWSRLRGANQYCLDEHVPEKQWQQQDKGCDRYAILNYTWARYKTVEVRVLPAFKLKCVAKDAVLEVCNIFENYCRAHSKERLTRATSDVAVLDDDVLCPERQVVQYLKELDTPEAQMLTADLDLECFTRPMLAEV